MGNVTLLPDELSIDGQLSTEILQRGIYKVNVYQSELVIKGFLVRKNFARVMWTWMHFNIKERQYA